MTEPINAQPALDKGTLKLFSNATFDLLQDPVHPDLADHLGRLASLTQSDLVLLYEASPGQPEFSLAAAHGLPPRLQGRFAVLGADESVGAGGLREPASPSREPVAPAPLTPDLLAMGIRAYWNGAVWLGNDYVGRLCFGSRRWQSFHKDAMAVFAATGTQLAWVIAKRRGATVPANAPTNTHPNAPALEPVEPTTATAPTTPGVADPNHFIAVLAHELRNPIAPIRSGLDLLSTGKVGDAVRRDTISMMQRQLAHLVRLMDDLLDTARLSTGRLPVQREPVLLRDVLEAAVESIQPALRAKALTLQVVEPGADVVVLADPVRLSQAFVNILNSNVKQTPAKGTISIGADASDQAVVLTFADQGEGLDQGQADNVFVLFPPDKSHVPDDGLSIGLALVKGLIELNGGAVDVKNRDLVAGSVFTVTLPLSDQPAPAHDEADGPSATNADWHSHRLLIVDDNRDAAEVLGLLFELDGKTIRLAHDGPAAVAAAAEFQPEVILMDMGLPGFNGLEAVRQIRLAQPEVRPCIVALTGWGAEADRKASREAGVDLHLVKPITYQELSAALSSLASPPFGRGEA